MVSEAWVENRGHNRFGLMKVVSGEVGNARAVAAADLDGDGTFTSHRVDPENGEGSDLVIAELTGDSIADVAVLTQNGVFVYPGRGDGSFAPPLPVIGPWIPVSGMGILTTADWDGDGDLDLPSVAPQSLRWMENLGNGGQFADFAQFGNRSAGRSLAVEDVDGDGRLDILTLDSRPMLYLGRDEGSPELMEPVGPENRIFNGIVQTAADLDLDGDLDLVIAEGPLVLARPALLTWLEQVAPGQFAEPRQLATLPLTTACTRAIQEALW